MENSNVQNLLDMLYSMIDEAKGVAFSSEKCIINREEALERLDEIRSKLPSELTRAQELLAAKDQYVANVKKKADQMLSQAREDAKTIVSESETLQRARQRGDEILHQAEDRSRELYQVANSYTEDALRRTEEAIQAALDEVRESRVRFRSASAEQMQACQDRLKAKNQPGEQTESEN